MPPLVGYAAAGHGIDVGALSSLSLSGSFLAFDAIAWMYRDDYPRSGIRMLPVIHPSSESAATRIVACSRLPIPISLAVSIPWNDKWLHAAAAITAGLGVLYFGARMGVKRSVRRAHALLLAKVIYRPALLRVMVLDRKSPSRRQHPAFRPNYYRLLS
jgi:heme o synthase